ncbi:hypothetical protein K8T06_02745 [bacterium]|nr:hypothetical protein [bacterium]
MCDKFNIKYSDLEKLLKKVPKTPIGEVRPVVAKATLSGNFSPEIGGILFTIKPDVSARIEAFNSVDDKDEDLIFNPLVFDPDKAWLKYRASASISSKADGATGLAKLGLEADQEVIFADYRYHDPNEDTLDAIKRDLPMRSILSTEDIENIGQDDALVYCVRGKLKGTLKLQWADVFSGTLNSLSDILPSTELIAIETQIGAYVELNISIEDDFRVVVT